MADLVCVCRARGMVFVFEVSDPGECDRKEYEMVPLAGDVVRCELKIKEELWGL